MLAVTYFRYWWLRPRMPDPQLMTTPSTDLTNPLSFSLTSLLAPPGAPQFDSYQHWTKVSTNTLEPFHRTAMVIEKALAAKKSLILIQPSIAGHVYSHYISHGWLLQENTFFYASVGLFFSYFFPRCWFIYLPVTVLALMHSWMYFKVYKEDRLSQYQAYDDDRHPISNLVTAMVLGQRPDHFQYVLKKERVVIWEIISEFTLHASVLSTLWSLKLVEEKYFSDRFLHIQESHFYLGDLLSLPAYASGYFQPPELITVADGAFLPVDIPYVMGWFDLPWFNIQFKPIKLDLAVIICGLAGYFVLKGFQHFFGYKEDEEISELDSEWTCEDDMCREESKSVYWVDTKVGEDEFKTDLRSVISGPNVRRQASKNALKAHEEATIALLTKQVPYGWIAPGYEENHYRVYT